MQPFHPDLLARAADAIPLFPLPGAVLFPHTLLPLHVFEPRYRRLVEDVLAHDGLIAVPCLAPGPSDAPTEAPALLPVCGVGRIVHHVPLADGRHQIVLAGVARLRLDEERATDTPYRLARATVLRTTAPTARHAALMAQVRSSLATLPPRLPPLAEAVAQLLGQDWPDEALLDAAGHLLLRDPRSRQQFLEEDVPESKAEAVLVAVAEVFGQLGEAAEA